MHIITIGVIVTILAYVVHLWTRNAHLKQLASKIPGPPVYPLVGNGLAITRHPKGVIYYLCDMQRKYGRIVRHWIGTSLYVHLTNPDDVEILLRDTVNITKSSTYDFLKPWLGEGLITSSGQHWHTHRKIITPAFHFNILEKFVEVFNEKGAVLMKLLSQKMDGKSFNIYPFINLYALDAIMETSMGTKFNAQENKESIYIKAIHRLAEIVVIRTFSPFLRSKVIFPLTAIGKEHDSILKTLHDHAVKVIQNKRDDLEISGELDMDKINEKDEFGKKKRLAFLDLLLAGQRAGSGLSDKDIIEEAHTFMFAGHDTTSSAMAFAIYYLSKHQTVQEKVYNEICQIFGPENNDLNLKDLNSTQYLDMVIKEVLRLTPPVSTYSRKIEKDLQLSKYLVPAGASVTVFSYMLHRNEEIFPNAEKFDPERFSAENSKNRHPYAYVPFSAGPRNCIGQKYAQLEIKSTLIKMIRNFVILPGDELTGVQSHLILTPTHGVSIQLQKRTRSA